MAHSSHKKYASFLTRLFSYGIDLAIYLFIYSIVDDNTGSMGLFLFLLWTGYVVWMNGTYGATIGKMVMKLKIVKESGKKITYQDALVREIASYLSLLVLFMGYLNILWSKKKQAWHDIIAKTVVVKA